MHRFHCSLRQLALMLAMVVTSPGMAADVLRVLAWPGYADPDVVEVFERRTDSRVEVTVIDSDESLWRRANGDGPTSFDVFAVNTAELQRYIRQGLVLPIDTAALSNRSRQLPRFRDLDNIPGIVHDGKAYAIPYTYAEMGLIYDRRQFETAPDSINVLWDPRYRGRILTYDGGAHSFSLAAQSLGLPSLFQLREQDWPAAVERLIALRRNVLSFYTQPQESADMFIRLRAALLFANFGSQQLQLLRAAGADVGYAIPREGALAWLDCWAIHRNSKNRGLATAWINYLLEEGPGAVLNNRQGLSSTTRPASSSGNEDRLIWLEPVESAELRNQLWGRIMSGDRASRVLAP
ncbi:spermidine/putrescine ABC transporter substrate-binding protein [Parazoarcus communis]|jgi:putative spermidine/putrescine transport system substrate-binding protein|uniref:Spermidine/putrescine ABC transporter substrate-binding protein n=1 Tax=Parazoarcus communis TaxID=41977 RepID=A0A2U8H491_9RHOO|nr:extracellular solute-binding protein [Parazoarcus communis]AWI79625.1 spermidine/putrescine ABC transporter substrate-binding protein [Parazoarcus communis]